MNKLAIRSRTLPALALLLGLLLRIWFVQHAAHADGDTLLYADFARNLLLHGVYGFTSFVRGLPAPPRPTLIRLPGYPLFLALCFRLFGIANYRVVMLVQVAVDLATCLLMRGLASRIFGSRAGLAVLWLASLCPFTASYTAAPLTETLSLFCIALAFYSLARWRESGAGTDRWLLGIGFALACAVLLRPEQGMLAAAVVPAMLFIARPLRAAIRPAVIVSLLTILPLIPWTIRNELTFHVFEPLAPRFATDPGENIPSGFQRWYRTWAIEFASTEQVYWNYDGNPIDIGDLPGRAFDSPAQYRATEALLHEYNKTSSATPALDRRFNAIAEQRIRAHPLRYYVFLPVARLLNMMLRPRVEMTSIPLAWWNYRAWPQQALEAGAYAALNLAYLVLGLWGFVRWRSLQWLEHQAIAWSMAATILMRCALLLTIDNSEPRYTIEFFPVLIVFAGALWMDASSSLSPRRDPFLPDDVKMSIEP